MNDLNEFFKLVSKEKKKTKKELDELISNSFDELFVKPLEESAKSKTPTITELKEDTEIPEETSFGTPTLIQKSLGLLAEPIKTNNSDPLTPLNQNFATLEDLQKHYKIFLDRIQQQLSTLGGGGEVRLEFLDDVNRNSVKVDNHYLKFDETTGKFLGSQILDDNYTTQIEKQGDDNLIEVINVPNTNLGPIQSLLFDPENINISDEVGLLNWNKEDRTLNLNHPGGVTQQIGQETYFLVRNETGSTIPNGTVVRFAGASNGDGEARLLVAPLLGNGEFPNLYTVGVLTQDIIDGDEGFATVFGKVRELNTTGIGVSETWNIGDILYANPNSVGKLSNVKPTAPDNVVPIAAVIKVDATNGEIFVRPTIEQRYSYGRFARNISFTYDDIDTPYVINLNETQISNGVSIGIGTTSKMTVDQSGFYKINSSIQLDTSGTKGICYLWIRKNGVDVPGTTRRSFITATEDIKTVSYSIDISLDNGDYVELCTASSSNDLRFNSFPQTAFAPSTAGVLISITQEVL